MYLHNAYESQAHVLPNVDSFYDRLAVIFNSNIFKFNRKHLNSMNQKDKLKTYNSMVWQLGFVLELNLKNKKYT